MIEIYFDIDIYELSSFNSINKNHFSSIKFIANYKKSQTVYYVKAMFPNQLINLIIANLLFRICLWQRVYS
ncbi:hypothetical protein h2es_1277 [Rickettsiales endosymbiont of Trichoplax sp. H2]|nr:hypothetical protein [Rickettsiales endosymbiont of Trichoplax sp. H2]